MDSGYIQLQKRMQECTNALTGLVQKMEEGKATEDDHLLLMMYTNNLQFIVESVEQLINETTRFNYNAKAKSFVTK